MELKDLREEIDQIDDQLVQLFSKRMAISAQVAAYKKEHNMPIFVSSREQDILDSIDTKVAPEIAPYTKELYCKIFELSRCYQSEQKL
ncbi:MAG: chorismate mutase [Oscillospiraceae bacterium]|nr:chorismate mutase [Oscillospiraceae bacterium]